MKQKINKLDMKILAELDKDSSQPINKIAKKLRINQATINLRLKKLIKNKIILGFYPSIDLSKLGFFAVRVYMDFKNTKPEKEKIIINELKSNKSCTIIAELEGNYDLMIAVTVKRIEEFYEFWKNFKEKHGKNISKEEVNIFIKVEHFGRRYLTKTTSQKLISVGMSKPEKIDEKSKKILSILAKDCRTSAVDVEIKTKIPARTVLHKIRQLENKKIILGYHTNLNLNAIGYEYYKINLKLNDYSKAKEINQLIRNNLNVIFIDYTISKWDIEIDLEVQNKKELKKFVDEIKEKYPNITEIEIISFSKYHKIETIPFY